MYMYLYRIFFPVINVYSIVVQNKVENSFCALNLVKGGEKKSVSHRGHSSMTKPVFLGSVLQGGAFYFLEHVVSDPSSWTFFFQHVLERLWFFLGDGCVVTRATWKDLAAAGFSDIHLRHIEAPDVTFLIRPHIMGYAIKWLVREKCIVDFAVFYGQKNPFQ